MRTQGSAITGGTNIGNMTLDGGLAAAFDGNTSQGTGAAASATVQNAYVGKTPSSSKRVFKMEAYGASNRGFANGTLSTTLTLYGKTGSAPASGTDGTSLGTSTFTDTQDATMRTITSTDYETLWDHIWLNITQGSVDDKYLAELILYEAV